MQNSKCKIKKEINILAIESSCDETAAAVIGEKNNKPVILLNVVSSQIDLHAKTGGVVPEVASRAHLESILPVIAEALSTAGLGKDDITHIAVTAGPGLIGSLLVGFNAAKSMAYALDKPIIPINHIEGHIYSAVSGEVSSNEDRVASRKIDFPVLVFTASGGHTLLALMRGHGDYQILGETLDDAAGEAYDKVARLLGLGYPGGPIVSKLASQFRSNPELATRNSELTFPRPMINDRTYNFSFSGLKTAVLYEVKGRKAKGESGLNESWKAEICAAFEEAVADVVAAKVSRAATEFKPKAIAFAGGVSANSYIKEKIEERTEQRVLVPGVGLSGDNAAMIGLAAYYHLFGDSPQWGLSPRGVSSWDKIKVDANWEIG